MFEIQYPDQPVYFIALTDGKVDGYGIVESNQCLVSGADALETFDSEELQLARLAELMPVPPEQPVEG